MGRATGWEKLFSQAHGGEVVKMEIAEFPKLGFGDTVKEMIERDMFMDREELKNAWEGKYLSFLAVSESGQMRDREMILVKRDQI